MSVRGHIRKVVAEKVQDNPDRNTSWIGRHVVSDLTEQEKTVAACAYIQHEATQVKRSIARSVEKDNIRKDDSLRILYTKGNRHRRSENEKTKRLERYRKWKESPEKLDLLNSRERDKFKTWLGDDFQDWLTRAKSVVASGGSVGHSVDEDTLWADWVGSHSELRVKRITNNVIELVREEAKQIKLKLTQDLLDSEFALGDGTTTTWGEASREHHEQRVGLLTKHSAGTLETAARHMAAINMLKDSQSSRLNELNKREEAA